MSPASRARTVGAAALIVPILLGPTTAHAAGGAFVVDDSEIGKPGECKVETWVSYADNRDAFLTTNPACVVKLGVPVELTAQVIHARNFGTWSTSAGAQAKINFISHENGGIGIGLVAAPNWDLATGVNNLDYAYVPVSVTLSKTVQLNINAGWQYDGNTGIHYASWGAGFEWKLGGPFTLLGEVFGFAGQRTPGTSITDPRAQIGLRYTPQHWMDIDLIYGRNINGEDANWVTVGLNIRFTP